MLRLLPILLLVPFTAATAQDTTAAAAPYDHDRDAPQAIAHRIDASIRVDGNLDEAAWRAATPVTRFTQYDPQEGQPVSEATDIRFLHDGDALYIGARMSDREGVRARVGRRDMSMSASDWLTVIIDARHDHRSSFGFEINPAGVRRDQTRAGGSEDDSWDPVWEAVTAVDDSGWTAEMRVPFSQLRFSGAPLQRWGLQIERQISRNQEFAVWAFTPRDQPGGAPRYGHLVGLENLATGKRLEVMPYVVSRAEHIDRGTNPFRSTREYDVDAGADLKYRVTSSLTLDATVNPDFGQVEVDPAVINLTAFETQFAEKRPFFIEGSELFRFANDGSNSVFYSRRIGRQPSLAPPFAARDVPQETRIIGAAKLTGRTAGGWSMGMLDAVTHREIARFRNSGGDYGETVAEPLTNYFVGRMRREARAGQTAFGGMVGTVHRDLDSELLAGALRSSAYSGGVDLFHQWARRTFTLNGFLVGSHVQGEPKVIAATQRLPYHYFQRPDADHLDYDPTRTSLSGFAGYLGLGKQVGRHWFFNGSMNTMSPGYEVSDLGFQRRADRFDVQSNINYQDTRPRGFVRRHAAYFNVLMEHNYGRENISNRLFLGGNAQFMNYYGGNVNLQVSLPNTVDDRLTRGGPAARRAGFMSLSGEIASDPRMAVTGFIGGSYRDGGNGHGSEVYGRVTVKPAPHWEVSLSPTFVRAYDVAQYLTQVVDPSATATYGSRYVFADLDQTIVALVTRINYTITPGLSLQVYAQPFLASGEFGPAKELAAPHTYAFGVYGQDVGEVANGRIYPSGQGSPDNSFAEPQPDFNSKSLRGNAVLRWEWRPGSTMYVAWQQTRRDFRPIGDFNFGRDVDALFSRSPDSILLLKVSYWLNP
jgi:hypothetical protein